MHALVLAVLHQDGADESLISGDLESGGSSFNKGLPPEWYMAVVFGCAREPRFGRRVDDLPRPPRACPALPSLAPAPPPVAVRANSAAPSLAAVEQCRGALCPSLRLVQG